MPIYEYECRKCGAVNEVLAKRGDKPPPCPACGSKKLRKGLSVFATLSGKTRMQSDCERFSTSCADRCPSAAACARDN